MRELTSLLFIEILLPQKLKGLQGLLILQHLLQRFKSVHYYSRFQNVLIKEHANHIPSSPIQGGERVLIPYLNSCMKGKDILITLGKVSWHVTDHSAFRQNKVMTDYLHTCIRRKGCVYSFPSPTTFSFDEWFSLKANILIVIEGATNICMWTYLHVPLLSLGLM